MNKSITAPLALIKAIVNGQLKTIGKIKTIRVTESISRVDVKGIGTLYPKERPVTNWSGTFTASSYLINLKEAGFSGSPNRNTNDAEKFANTLLLNDIGIQIHVYRKIKGELNPNTGIVESVLEEPFAIIENAFIETESFDISEGQVGGRDQSFSYLTPILFDSVVA
jgi:hypothetical protein